MLFHPRHSLLFRWVVLSGYPLFAVSCAAPVGIGQPVPRLEQILPEEELRPSTESLDSEDSFIQASGLKHFLRGAYFFQSQRFEEAVDELRLALIYFPDSAFLHQQLSETWQALGDYSKSKRVLRAGLTKIPSSPLLNYKLGLLLHREMKFQNATRYLEKASQSEFHRVIALPFLVSSQLWLGNFEKAQQATQLLLKSKSVEKSPFLKVAETLEEHGFYDEAWKLYAKVRGIYPDDQPASLGQMRIELLRGNISGAAATLIPLYGHQSNSIALSSLISKLFSHGGRSEAEAYRQDAIRQAYGEELALLKIVSDDIGAGRVKAGMELIESLIQRNPQSEKARLVAARMNSDQLRYSKCLQYLEQAGEQNREFNVQRALCWGGLDHLESMLGEFSFAYTKGASLKVVTEGAAYWLARKLSYDEAMNRFEAFCVELVSHSLSKECISGKATIADFFGYGEVAIGLMEEFQILNDRRVDWVIRLADMYCRYERLTEGLQILEELVRQAPYDLVRLNALGFRLVEAGQGLEEASVWLHRAYRLAPESGFIIDSLGWLLYRQGRYQEALGFMRMAVSHNPNDPEIQRHLGDVYWKLGQGGDALSTYQQALTNYPNTVLLRVLSNRVSMLDPKS